MNTVEKSRESLTEVVDSPKVQTKREDEFFAVIHDENHIIQQDRRIPRSKLRRTMSEFAEQLFGKEIRGLYIRRCDSKVTVSAEIGSVETLNTIEKSREKIEAMAKELGMRTEDLEILIEERTNEDKFFAVTIDDDKVIQYRRISQSKLIGNISEFAEQLFEKKIRTFYIVTN